MGSLISVIIPNRNGGRTIERCLEAAFLSEYAPFEVIVVDDCSDDRSVEIIRRFPCKLIVLEKHSGASRARNVGAQNSKGDILFFTDADCLLERNTLSAVNGAVAGSGTHTVVGGTYTREPFDRGFFSLFQSIFINYFETRNADSPDYVATHAMAMRAGTFRESDGFSEDFLPILEDVEFSHRLRKKGYRLEIIPGILVRHIFNYSLIGSLKNAIKKSRRWTFYSLMNRDILADSGTASIALKVNVLSSCLGLLLLSLWKILESPFILYALPAVYAVNIFVNGRLFYAFYETRGTLFALSASIYYMLLYSLAVGAGAITGAFEYMFAALRNGGRGRGYRNTR